jgi:excisionase family DNA binding protein
MAEAASMSEEGGELDAGDTGERMALLIQEDIDDEPVLRGEPFGQVGGVPERSGHAGEDPRLEERFLARPVRVHRSSRCGRRGKRARGWSHRRRLTDLRSLLAAVPPTGMTLLMGCDRPPDASAKAGDVGRRVGIGPTTDLFIALSLTGGHNRSADGPIDVEEVGSMWMDVAEAAHELGVDARQVRRLAAAGELVARRVGGVWLIDSDSVRDRRQRSPKAGRPLSEEMAWGAAALLAHCLHAPDSPGNGGNDDHFFISQHDEHFHGDKRDAHDEAVFPDRRAMRRLRRLLENPPPVEYWPQWMRNRSQRRRLRIHPGVLERFARDARVARVDPSVFLGVGGSQERFYVAAHELADVLHAYRAKDDPDGNVDIQVLDEVGVDAVRSCPAVLEVSAAVDMVASPNARERHAARALLAAAVSHASTRQR